MNWWARHRAVRAENAAIAGLRFEPLAAVFAIVEELAGIRRHVLSRLMAALGASDCGVCDHAESILKFASDRDFRNVSFIKA